MMLWPSLRAKFCKQCRGPYQVQPARDWQEAGLRSEPGGRGGALRRPERAQNYRHGCEIDHCDKLVREVELSLTRTADPSPVTGCGHLLNAFAGSCVPKYFSR